LDLACLRQFTIKTKQLILLYFVLAFKINLLLYLQHVKEGAEIAFSSLTPGMSITGNIVKVRLTYVFS